MPAYYALIVPALPLLGGALIQVAPTARSQDWINRVTAALTAAAAFGAAVLAVVGADKVGGSDWVVLDTLGAPFLGRHRVRGFVQRPGITCLSEHRSP